MTCPGSLFPSSAFADPEAPLTFVAPLVPDEPPRLGAPLPVPAAFPLMPPLSPPLLPASPGAPADSFCPLAPAMPAVPAEPPPPASSARVRERSWTPHPKAAPSINQYKLLVDVSFACIFTILRLRRMQALDQRLPRDPLRQNRLRPTRSSART